MGYYPDQIADLEQTISATDCDVVLVGTPFDLAQRLRSDKPMLRVRYVTEESQSEPGAPTLADAVLDQLTKLAAKAIA